jgi:uncharacterized protein
MPPSRKQAVLLVDGYNVIGAWTDLHAKNNKRNPLQSGSREELEASRSKLIEALINYSAYEDYQTKVVFDAYSRDAPAYTEIITPNLSVTIVTFSKPPIHTSRNSVPHFVTICTIRDLD